METLAIGELYDLIYYHDLSSGTPMRLANVSFVGFIDLVGNVRKKEILNFPIYGLLFEQKKVMQFTFGPQELQQ